MNLRRMSAVLVFLCLGAFAVYADENPLADAKAGEWVLQKNKISYPGGSMTQFVYMYVSKVEGKKITYVTQMLKEDGKTGMMAGTSSEIDLDAKPAGEAPKDAPQPKTSEDTVDVGGKKIKCKKAEMVNETAGIKTTIITWTSNDVPVFGTVKQVVLDKDGKETSVSELVEFGTSGGADKPL